MLVVQSRSLKHVAWTQVAWCRSGISVAEVYNQPHFKIKLKTRKDFVVSSLTGVSLSLNLFGFTYYSQNSLSYL